jgi:hypothetical protein
MKSAFSQGEAAGLQWAKSSYSDSSNSSECVEIAAAPPTIHVRDSKNPGGPRLAVEAGAWTEFVAFVTYG